MTLLQTRTFFGVLRVATDGTTNSEYSGTTLHGSQYLDARRSEPTVYYVRTGPLGEIFRDLDARTDSASVGVVGLGVGTTIDYARPSDRFTFYEIDQAVVDIANDPRYFTDLRDAPLAPRVVVGDGSRGLRLHLGHRRGPRRRRPVCRRGVGRPSAGAGPDR